MKTILLIVLSIFIFSCNSPEKKEITEISENEKPDSITEVKPAISDEDKCVSMVEILPEVNSLADEISKNSQDKNHLSIWIAADPIETKIKYYWVKVGEDNGDNIATLLNFYVDPRHDEVLYYDVVGDTLITLKEWREKTFKK
jgi:hypothetical protein